MTSVTLTVGGDRNQIMKVADAEQILARFQEELAQAGDGAKVETIDISCRVWKEETLNVLADFLVEKVVPSIRYLNMDDVIASLETSIGLQTIRVLTGIFRNAPHLTRLDSSDNALGERAAEIMRPLFCLPTLKELRLFNDGMSAEVGLKLVEAFLPEGRETTSLTHLYLGKNQLGTGGAIEIAKIVRASPHLEYFSYRGSRPLKDGTKALLEAFAALAQGTDKLKLVTLDINDATVGSGEEDDDCIEELIATLKKCPHLENLDLGEAMIGPDGTARVIQAITESGAKLKSLGLGSVDMRVDEAENGVDALCEIFTTDTGKHLEELVLETNELEDEGTATIIQALATAKMSNLKTLSLADNIIGEEGATALVEHKIDSLNVLDLSSNDDIPEELAIRLVRMYKGCQVLLAEDIITQDLAEEDNKDQGVEDLVDAFSQQKI